MRPLSFAPLFATVAAATLALAGCNQGASPETTPNNGIALSEGKLVLPAVKGNPGAAYFTIANKGDKPIRLAAVEVAGTGMAMFHETMEMDGHSTMQDMTAPEVKAGEIVTFAPGGKHVMVHDVPDSLAAGKAVTMTITTEDGQKATTPLKVTKPGMVD